MSDKGTVFRIQRFSSEDGPGIRTVVFLKGCPLRCAWCHNPESHLAKPEILFRQERCIGCKACETVCPNRCHRLTPERHCFLREGCTLCGRCMELCPTGALELCGKEQTAGQVLEAVLRDVPFYKESGGGMTLSGGEPLMQFDFSLALLRLAKQAGLHTAIETSGYTAEDLSLLVPYTDLWLYDIKLFPEEAHKQHTGVSNRMILENLYRLDRLGANMILRCPIIPGINMTEEHFAQISRLAAKLSHVLEIHLEPYHPLGIAKARLLDRQQPYDSEAFLSRESLEPFAQQLHEQTHLPVVL